jgi:hypothetical protein
VLLVLGLIVLGTCWTICQNKMMELESRKDRSPFERWNSWSTSKWNERFNHGVNFRIAGIYVCLRTPLFQISAKLINDMISTHLLVFTYFFTDWQRLRFLEELDPTADRPTTIIPQTGSFFFFCICWMTDYWSVARLCAQYRTSSHLVCGSSQSLPRRTVTY